MPARTRSRRISLSNSAFCGAPQNAEFERNLIRERTLAGLKAARARGRKGGRPRKLSPKDIQAIQALLHAGQLPVQDIADRFDVSRSTPYRTAAAPEVPKVLKRQPTPAAPASKIPAAETGRNPRLSKP
jgi:DNA invertase Pin-like site-specific DNA recombinase